MDRHSVPFLWSKKRCDRIRRDSGHEISKTERGGEYEGPDCQ